MESIDRKYYCFCLWSLTSFVSMTVIVSSSGRLYWLVLRLKRLTWLFVQSNHYDHCIISCFCFDVHLFLLWSMELHLDFGNRLIDSFWYNVSLIETVPPERIVILDEKRDEIRGSKIGPLTEDSVVKLICRSEGGEYFFGEKVILSSLRLVIKTKRDCESSTWSCFSIEGLKTLLQTIIIPLSL
jgi:hypothetical protein